MESLTSVLVVDDHPAIVDAWRAAIDDQPDMRVTGAASSLAQATAMLASQPPFDVVVADVRLGDGSGLTIMGLVDLTRTRVIMVSANVQPVSVETSQRRGASGFVVKTSPTAHLVDAIRSVAAGGMAWDPEAVVALRQPSRWDLLTNRERDIVACIVDGHTNKQVGERLGIGVKTVETHVTHLFRRLGVESRVDLVRRAKDEGWLDTPPH